MHVFDRIGILGPGFLIFLGLLFTAVAASAAVVGRRHQWYRWLGGLLSVVVALAFVAASVNNHYAYLPNLGSLWGWRAADQANWAVVGSPTSERINRAFRLSGRGAVVEAAIPGTVSHFRGRPAAIYLPPAWFRRPHPALPVVLLLHGSPGSPRDWTRSAGADVTSDRYAAKHGGRAPIIVSPDINGSFTGDSECTNGTAGNVETYLTVDVPHWVDGYLHPSRLARQWAVGGLSEGGTCAMALALRHPTEFPTFLDFGGEEQITHHGGAMSLFRGTGAQRMRAVKSYDPIFLLEHFRRAGRVSGWFDVGTSDRGTSTAVERLYGRALRLGMHVHLKLTLDGHHSFRVWKLSFAGCLPWLGQRLLIDRPPRPVTSPGRTMLASALGAAARGISSTRIP